jgi:hypothetical protein
MPTAEQIVERTRSYGHALAELAEVLTTIAAAVTKAADVAQTLSAKTRAIEVDDAR